MYGYTLGYNTKIIQYYDAMVLYLEFISLFEGGDNSVDSVNDLRVLTSACTKKAHIDVYTNLQFVPVQQSSIDTYSLVARF